MPIVQSPDTIAKSERMINCSFQFIQVSKSEQTWKRPKIAGHHNWRVRGRVIKDEFLRARDNFVSLEPCKERHLHPHSVESSRRLELNAQIAQGITSYITCLSMIHHLINFLVHPGFRTFHSGHWYPYFNSESLTFDQTFSKMLGQVQACCVVPFVTNVSIQKVEVDFVVRINSRSFVTLVNCRIRNPFDP